MSEVVHDRDACSRAWQLLRLAHDRVATRLATELTATCGLAITEFDVLLALRLHAGEPVRIGTLLDAVPLSQPALSRSIGRLESRGLVQRTTSEDDGRAILVQLTKSGADLAERAIEVHVRVVDETLTGRFTPDEQADLLRALARITH